MQHGRASADARSFLMTFDLKDTSYEHEHEDRKA